MDYSRLQAEVAGDPVTLGYSGKTDQQTADLLNSLATGRTLNRTQVNATEIMGAIASATPSNAWPTSASKQESMLLAILGLPFVDASNVNIRAIFGEIFPNAGNTATTRANLLALGTQTVSRATELALGPVIALDVNRAKAGVW
jgi:hypothetical protein